MNYKPKHFHILHLVYWLAKLPNFALNFFFFKIKPSIDLIELQNKYELLKKRHVLRYFPSTKKNCIIYLT
jgi:hypothetical protein